MRKTLPWIYLLIAGAGAIFPWQANLDFIRESASSGFELQRFITEAISTSAGRSLSADLLIGATAVSIWICVEGTQQKIRGWWIAILLSVTVAFACGAPFFLFLRERTLQERAQESVSGS